MFVKSMLSNLLSFYLKFTNEVEEHELYADFHQSFLPSTVIKKNLNGK